MKRSLAILGLLGAGIVPAAADIPVIDKTNYAVARDTAEKTGKILDTNKEILTTVEETLKAVTGERSSDAGPLKDIAIGNGFSVSSMPSFDSILKSGIANFGSLDPKVVEAATAASPSMTTIRTRSGSAAGSVSRRSSPT